MRIAYLTHYAELYGANRCLLDLVLRTREAHGVSPHVMLAHEGPLIEVLGRHGVPHAVFPWKPWMGRAIYMGGPHHRLAQRYRQWGLRRERAHHNAALLPAIAEQCRAWGIGLLHVNSSVIGLGGGLARAVGVPWVWHVREFFGLHFGYRADGGTRAFVRALWKADAVVAVSRAVRAELHRQAGADLPVEVVYDGVASEAQAVEWAARAADRWNGQGPFRFVLAGVFHPSKGQMEAVEAMARLRDHGVDARLVLVGDGDTGPVRRRIGELRLGDHVELTGFVTDPIPYFQQAHCALTCSRHEAYGRVTLEALTTGIPVIGHRSGGTPELIDDGRTGLLYDSPEELFAHMLRMARDPAAARALGTAAMRGIAAGRGIEAMARDMARIYCSVLRPSGR